MMQIMFSLFMIFTSLMFMNMVHPLSLGLTLLLQTLNMCIMIGMISKSFWLSFILFLILLGGMLVLFMYVVSLAPNEKFTLSPKLMSLILIFFLLSILTTMMDKMEFIYFSNNNEMMTTNNLTTYFSENSLSLNKLYNPPTHLMTMVLIIYLLITLIIVVHITKASFGPLRKFNKM